MNLPYRHNVLLVLYNNELIVHHHFIAKHNAHKVQQRSAGRRQGNEGEMKGNTKKTDMCGFGACLARKWGSRQKPIQLPSSRADGGKGAKSPEAKHNRRAQQKFNKTGGIPRGKTYAKMYRLGYRSDSRKDFMRGTR